MSGYTAERAYVMVWRPAIVPYHLEVWVHDTVEKWEDAILVQVTNTFLDRHPVCSI